jgi:predicted nucleic acid-binding protein
MQYFFDTSAVVKIYHEEEGSDVIEDILTLADKEKCTEILELPYKLRKS